MLRYVKIGASIFLLLGISSLIGAILNGKDPLYSFGLAIGMLGTLILLNMKEDR
jgi:hypothetical protein